MPQKHFRAQHGEDVWLEEHWDELGLPSLGEPGYYVEFGAGDGVDCSNTYFLEHGPRGWRGLLCEPDPRQKKLGLNRPESCVERCCVGPYDVVSLGLCQDPMLSGELRAGASKNHDERLQVVSRVAVQQIPLTALLSRHEVPRVDLLSVDTEGTEVYALSSLDWERWRPTVCIVELSTWGMPDELLGGGGEQRVLEFMEYRGYGLRHKTRCNGIFAA